MPRKNILAHIEGEQVKLTKLIDETRAQIKTVARQLLCLEPNLSDLEPATAQMLLAERNKKDSKLMGGTVVEESEESD